MHQRWQGFVRFARARKSLKHYQECFKSDVCVSLILPFDLRLNDRKTVQTSKRLVVAKRLPGCVPSGRESSRFYPASIQENSKQTLTFDHVLF